MVEEGLSNSSGGRVVSIVYAKAEGPRDPNALPLYVVVDFPDYKCTGEPWDPRNPTHVPIAPTTQFCEKRCCSVTQIPLMIGKVRSIHKSQGITVCDGQTWKKLVVCIGEKESSTPGLLYVALSRVGDIKDFAFYNLPENFHSRLLKTGQGKSYTKRNEFMARLKELSNATIRKWTDLIKGHHATFEAGYEDLVRRFDDKVGIQQ